MLNLAKFFGDLSIFEIFVSVIAILTGGYTAYKNFLERTKISLYPADAVRLIVSSDSSVSKFHLICNLVNKSTKTGTLHRLEVKVCDPRNWTYNYVWKLFYKYSPTGIQIEKETDPYPISVAPKDSKVIFVEFKAIEILQSYSWQEGTYEFKVIGWINRKNRKGPHNLKSNFHIYITSEILNKLRKHYTKDTAVPVPIAEWTPCGC